MGGADLPEHMKPPAGSMHSVESASGRKLLKMMIADRFNYAKPHFKTMKYEKPMAKVGDDVISVSFSHTKKAVAAVVSDRWVVGIDMELISREVNEHLSKRMKHPDETLKFYKNHPIIQIWTMKEAALKAIGTGLRKPMNSVCLEAVSENVFSVKYFNGTIANICSFRLNGQWLSICYITSELTEHFLSENYVPIQTGRDQKSHGKSG